MNIPVKPMDAGQIAAGRHHRRAVGAADAVAGQRRGGGSGTGTGTGSGPGRGSGLGDGEGGGTGGGAYQIGNGVMPPDLIHRTSPQYTAEAMRAKIQGISLLSGIVGVDGTLQDIRISRSLDGTFGLDQEAIKCVRQWRFRPGTRQGQPVPGLRDHRSRLQPPLSARAAADVATRRRLKAHATTRDCRSVPLRLALPGRGAARPHGVRRGRHRAGGAFGTAIAAHAHRPAERVGAGARRAADGRAAPRGRRHPRSSASSSPAVPATGSGRSGGGNRSRMPAALAPHARRRRPAVRRGGVAAALATPGHHRARTRARAGACRSRR